MATLGFEDLQVYRLAEQLADEVWRLVLTWEPFAKSTVGKQVVRSADSVAANIAEGTGRGSYQDNQRFVKIPRGSLYEPRHWLRQAHMRHLIHDEQAQRLKHNSWTNSLPASTLISAPSAPPQQTPHDQQPVTNNQ